MKRFTLIAITVFLGFVGCASDNVKEIQALKDQIQDLEEKTVAAAPQETASDAEEIIDLKKEIEPLKEQLKKAQEEDAVLPDNEPPTVLFMTANTDASGPLGFVAVTFSESVNVNAMKASPGDYLTVTGAKKIFKPIQVDATNPNQTDVTFTFDKTAKLEASVPTFEVSLSKVKDTAGNEMAPYKAAFKVLP